MRKCKYSNIFLLLILFGKKFLRKLISLKFFFETGVLIFFLLPSLLTGLEQIDLDNKLMCDIEDLKKLNFIIAKGASSNKDIDFLQQFVINYSNNAYSCPKFINGYYTLVPKKKKISKEHKTVQDIDTYWNKEAFLEPRPPIKIGEVEEKNLFSKIGCPRCCHLLIKFPEKELRIPNEYIQFKESIEKIISFEYSCNPNFDKYYAYLTVDQRFVPKQCSQRISGAHVDGIPRDRKNPSTQKIDHCYLISDKIPTKFYVQDFDFTNYNLLEHNFFGIMELLKNENKTIYSVPYDINLINAYTVHTSTLAENDCVRTLFRLEFSELQFDRKGNSINPYFEYNWKKRKCHPPSNLVIPNIKPL